MRAYACPGRGPVKPSAPPNTLQMPPTRKAVAAADAPAKKKAAAIAVAKPDTGMVGKSWLGRLYRPLAVVAVAGACGLLLAFIGTGTPAGLAGWLDGLPTERWLTPAVALLMLPALALWWHLVWALEADIKDEVSLAAANGTKASAIVIEKLPPTGAKATTAGAKGMVRETGVEELGQAEHADTELPAIPPVDMAFSLVTAVIIVSLAAAVATSQPTWVLAVALRPLVLERKPAVRSLFVVGGAVWCVMSLFRQHRSKQLELNMSSVADRNNAIEKSAEDGHKSKGE